MRISDSELRQIEALSMIRLDDESRERFLFQMSRIIDFLRKIDEEAGLDEAGGAVAEVEDDRAREDDPAPGLDRDEVLRQAPDRFEGYFRVPPVLGETEEP